MRLPQKPKSFNQSKWTTSFLLNPFLLQCMSVVYACTCIHIMVVHIYTQPNLLPISTIAPIARCFFDGWQRKYINFKGWESLYTKSFKIFFFIIIINLCHCSFLASLTYIHFVLMWNVLNALLMEVEIGHEKYMRYDKFIVLFLSISCVYVCVCVYDREQATSEYITHKLQKQLEFLERWNVLFCWSWEGNALTWWKLKCLEKGIPISI